jgi:hypothetical protein
MGGKPIGGKTARPPGGHTHLLDSQYGVACRRSSFYLVTTNDPNRVTCALCKREIQRWGNTLYRNFRNHNEPIQ